MIDALRDCGRRREHLGVRDRLPGIGGIRPSGPLHDGDSVAIAGELTPKVWTDKHGEAKPALDLVAHKVMSPYDVQRKRKAVAEAHE